MTKRTCTIEGCDKGDPIVRGLCRGHYHRLRRYGDPLGKAPIIPRRGARLMFVESVIDGTAKREPNGCILWPLALNSTGYPPGMPEPGTTSTEGRRRQVAPGRIVLSHLIGPSPTPAHTMGHAPHDICGNKHCIAPEHLSWQTPKQQVAQQQRDGTAKPPPRRTGEKASGCKYTNEQVAAAVARVRAGETSAAVARDIGAAKSVVWKWVNGRSRADAI